MIVALAQMRVWPGQIMTNLEQMRALIGEAKDRGVQLVAFPEQCLGGYLIGDWWTRRSFTQTLLDCDAELQELSRGIALVYGNVWIDPTRRNRDGRVRLYNAVRLFADGQAMVQIGGRLPPGVAVKTLQPNYRVFDDSRYFTSLLDLALDDGQPLEDYLRPFVVPKGVAGLERDYRLAPQICEDLWFGDYQVQGRPLNIAAIQTQFKPDLIVNCSASPWTYGKDDSRHRRVKEALGACQNPVPFAYVNCVGVQNNGKNFVTFDGGSVLYSPDARPITQAPEPYEPSLVISSIQAEPGRSFGRPGSLPSVAQPSLIPAAKTRAQYRAAIEGIRAVDQLLGSSFPWVIGLSGGIDSAVNLALLHQACGPERIRAFNLPSRYNSEATRSAAVALSGALGLDLASISIETLVEANEALLEEFRPQTLHRENIQAKIRGTSILSNIAGILGGAMINNGNKVEIALGYATLYGDVNGVLAPLGDLLKTEIFALAKFLNDEIYGEEVIPTTLLPDDQFAFTIPPSAELKANQRDPMKWGYHDALLNAVLTYQGLGPEDVFELYASNQLWAKLQVPAPMVTMYGLDRPADFVADFEWFWRCLTRSVYKRIQAPPIVIMSRSSFGYDFRESQIVWEPSRRYVALRQKILNQVAD